MDHAESLLKLFIAALPVNIFKTLFIQFSDLTLKNTLKLNLTQWNFV